MYFKLCPPPQLLPYCVNNKCACAAANGGSFKPSHSNALNYVIVYVSVLIKTFYFPALMFINLTT